MKDTKNQNTNDKTLDRDLKRMERITCAAAQVTHLQLRESPTPAIYLASWTCFNVLIAQHFAYDLENNSTKEVLKMLIEGLNNELNNMEENGEK